MVGSPLTSAHRLRDRSSNFTWRELRSELSRQYSSIPFDSHATKAFVSLYLAQDEPLEMYLHHASEHFSKIHHLSDMSQISVEGLKQYTIVYGLNCRNLKYSVVGHWRLLQRCPYFYADYERAKS